MKSYIKHLDKFVITFFVLTLVLTVFFQREKNEPLYTVKVVHSYNKFSEQKLIHLIDSLNFKYPEIVLAQARLESAHFNSNVFRSNNNLFGMRQAASRITLNNGSRNGYANYRRWEDSVIDYALWYATYAYKCQNEDEFLDLLHRTYAENNIYKLKLKEMIKTQKLKEKFLQKGLVT